MKVWVIEFHFYDGLRMTNSDVRAFRSEAAALAVCEKVTNECVADGLEPPEMFINELELEGQE